MIINNHSCSVLIRTQSRGSEVHNCSNLMLLLAGLGFKKEEDHLNIEIVTAMLFKIPAHYLVTYMEICVTKTINLRTIQLGWQPLKKVNHKAFVKH